jgi:sugar lactone lactonase YvrE
MRHFYVLLALGFTLLSTGCYNRVATTKIDPNELMVFPAPPEEPRIQFITAYSSSSDIKPFRKIDQFLLGSSLFELEVGIEKPYGIALKDGKIYICDTMLPGLVIIDLENRTLRPFQPFGRGALRKPVNLTIDNQGYIYVADTDRQQVVVYTPDLKYVDAISSGSLKPLDVAIMGDTLFIADYQDRNIEVWSLKRRRMIGLFPPKNEEAPDSEKVFVPYALAVDRANHVYVTDFGQFRIQKYDRDGRYLETFGGLGRALGQFARPKGISVDHEENLFVVDAAFENVQIFDKNGNLLMFFGGPYQQPGNMYLPAQVIVDYDHLQYFQDYILPEYKLVYLILVTNQYGPDKIGIYGRIEPTEAKEPE